MNMSSSEFQYKVENSLVAHVQGAIGRLAYSHSQATFEYDAISQLLICNNLDFSENLGKSISHALYREKIYSETLPLRMKLLNLLG